MDRLKLVMLGTGDFAVPTFRALLDSPHEVRALYTQPDRVRAGQDVHANPMKELALARGVPVYQPERVNAPEVLADLRELAADLFVVAAYGQILSAELLKIPRLGAINVHASLLPKYRGAAPINFAIWNGETETGVTLFQIQPRLDAGPLLAVVRTPIDPEETAGELEVRLAELAAPLTVATVQELAEGTAKPVPQDPHQVSLAPKLTKEMGQIDWGQPAERVVCQVRALQPWPTAFSYCRIGSTPRRFVFRKVSVVEDDTGGPCAEPGAPLPGTVVRVDREHLWIQTATRPISVREIQPEGKRTLPVAEFLRGYRLQVGDQFGPLALFAESASSP